MDIGGGWVIDMDIRSYFDSVDRSQLSRVLDQRVRDGVIRRVIGKWLHAGVMEEGRLWYPERGTPQGGVASPLLANIYLHEVLDTWFEDEVKPRMSGRAFMVRFADDAVLCFERETDARRVMQVLAKRLARFGLELHPDKTRLVDFRHPGRRERTRGSRPGESGRFDYLAFTHFWARSRKGRWVVKRKTAKGRFGRSLKRVAQWCRFNRHRSVREQHAALCRKLHGHYAYFGITGNARALARALLASRTGVAPVARPALVACGHDLGALRSSARTLSIAHAARRSQCLSCRSESLDRGTGCGSSARPVLWEPRVSNRPGPPGRLLGRNPRRRHPRPLPGHLHGVTFTHPATRAMPQRHAARVLSRGSSGTGGAGMPDPRNDSIQFEAGLAQLVEQLPCKHQVGGSTPSAGTKLPSSDVQQRPRKTISAREYGLSVLHDVQRSVLTSGGTWGYKRG